MPVTVIVGGQYGSEGKGKMTSYLALKDNAAAVVRCGGPNAGHTVDHGGERHVVRQIPAGYLNPNTRLFLAAGAVVDREVLLDEVERHGVQNRIGIDRDAAVIEQSDRDLEAKLKLRKRISSTLTGTGAVTSRKVLRDPALTRAADIEEFRRWGWVTDVSREANALHDQGLLVLVEGTQGFGLSLHHGDQYPFRTSRDTTAAAFLSEAGLSPLTVWDIVLVIRTFPIRVGGPSGPLRDEISWEELREQSGYPEPVAEYTSVTGTKRRIARFDVELVRRAVQANRPTQLAIHGLDYLDHENLGARCFADLTRATQTFLCDLEGKVGLTASFLFTGPPNENVIERRGGTDSARESLHAVTRRS